MPPGTYTLVAWHEKYPQGRRSRSRSARARAKTADFSFTAQQLAAESLEGGALRVMPALDLPMLGGHH